MDVDPEDLEEPIPSANSPIDQGDDESSSSGNTNESSASSGRSKEGRIKQAMDINAQELPPVTEGEGDSASAAPSSSQTEIALLVQPTPPASASTQRRLNDLGFPEISS